MYVILNEVVLGFLRLYVPFDIASWDDMFNSE